MSHIVTVKTEVRDPVAVAAACRRLGLAEPVQGTAQLFSDQATGLLIRLPGWLCPVVCTPATGELRYDNYNGAWGGEEQLDRFKQSSAVEKATLEARKKGSPVSESSLADRSIRLQILAGA